jgi:hypothetical protein
LNWFQFQSQALKNELRLKLHLFDLLWICCPTSLQQSITNPQQIERVEFELWAQQQVV